MSDSAPLSGTEEQKGLYSVSYIHFTKKFDWLLAMNVLFLSGIGLLTIYTVDPVNMASFVKKQILILCFGFILMCAISFFDYRIFRNNSFVLIALYLFALAALVGVLFSQQIRGSSSWFRFGSLYFEPMEFAKIVLILFFAKYFSHRHIEMYRARHVIVSGFYTGLFVTVAMLQPDFGSILVLTGIWLGIIVIAGIKPRHLIILGMAMLLLFAVSWFGILKGYQKDRILIFLNPQIDPYGAGYHVSQSLIAVGSGGWFGQNLGLEPHAGLKFLPEQHTDFIFAALAEQRGLFGVFVLLAGFAFLLWRIILIALKSSNNFSRLFAAGFAILVFVQMSINIGMNIAILPITGLTLPFVSYGGSSLASMFIGLGILQSIRMRNS